MKEVAPKIFLLTGTCNTYYIDDKKKVLVDAGFNIDKRVDLIIITHGHPDHILFANKIKNKNLKCMICSSLQDKELIEKLPDYWASWAGSKVPKVIVDKLLEESQIINTGIYSFRVIETPGHTPGSLCLYDERKGILISGDTLFAEGITGRTDLVFSNPEDMKYSLAKIGRLKINLLLPGHGWTEKTEY